MPHIDKRIQVNTIIENQLPEFVVSDFPNATEFLKQYYISQEFQGGTSDLINNFDLYLSFDVSKSTINTIKDVIASGEDVSGVVFQRDYYTSSYSNGDLERK